MSDTPMIQQYRKIKEKHQESILFFRMGDFYEMFFEDAKIASKVLGITLTARNKGGTNPVPMAGVPVKAVDSYLQKMLQEGYKVAICEQIQDPALAQGLVDRDVIRIITPGTLTEQEVLHDKSNNFLLSIHLHKKKIGIAWVDISTGKFLIHELEEKDLEDEIVRIMPAECLISEKMLDKVLKTSGGDITLEKLIQLLDIPLTHRPAWFFESENGEKILQEHFSVKTLEGFGCESMKWALGASGALLQYIEETQKTSLCNVDSIEVYNATDTMFLDRASRYCLEILKTMRGDSKKGTLLSILDETSTSMGGRLLALWLGAPLISVEKIRARQEGVKEFFLKPQLIISIREQLRLIQDVERLCSRIAYQRANARDLLAVKNSLEIIPKIYNLLGKMESLVLKTLKKELISLDDLFVFLEKAIHLEPKLTLKDGGIIKDGYNGELDELRSLQHSSDSWLKKFEKAEIEKTGISTLKVNYNKVFGFYIEVTHANSHKVPKEYIRKQTLKNAERYITPELKEYEGKVVTANERAKALEYELFLDIRNKVSEALPDLRKVANAIAWIDVLVCLAKVARDNNYICPEIDSTFEISIEDGRHPVLEITSSSFVPNSLFIGPGKEIILITGPNMAGKSTYIRQAALLILMAQIGSFIPAKNARIGIVDRIFTRIGASDEIARGRSTFMVEMIETANILNNATDKSFIALDEIGRGTSTFDGISLAWAIIEYIQKKIKARTLFATHYHEIAELEEMFPNIQNFNVAIEEYGDKIAFIYKIARGSADKSYGIHVARLAGIPKLVINRGKSILGNLERHAIDFQDYTKRCAKSGKFEENLFSLVGEDIIDTLAHLDINNLTPVEALGILKDLQNEAKNI